MSEASAETEQDGTYMTSIALTLPISQTEKSARPIRRRHTEVAVPLLLRFLFWATRNSGP
jgi:hypothetical protein